MTAAPIRDLRVAQAIVFCACFGLTLDQAAEAMGVSRSRVASGSGK